MLYDVFAVQHYDQASLEHIVIDSSLDDPSLGPQLMNATGWQQIFSFNVYVASHPEACTQLYLPMLDTLLQPLSIKLWNKILAAAKYALTKSCCPTWLNALEFIASVLHTLADVFSGLRKYLPDSAANSCQVYVMWHQASSASLSVMGKVFAPHFCFAEQWLECHATGQWQGCQMTPVAALYDVLYMHPQLALAGCCPPSRFAYGTTPPCQSTEMDSI